MKGTCCFHSLEVPPPEHAILVCYGLATHVCSMYEHASIILIYQQLTKPFGQR